VQLAAHHVSDEYVEPYTMGGSADGYGRLLTRYRLASPSSASAPCGAILF